MLRFQRVIANGLPVFVPAGPSRNFMGEAQEAPVFDEVPFDPNAGRRWVPPSRRYPRPMPPIRVTGWQDHYAGWQPGDPKMIVDHAPPPVGYHYDDKWQLVADVPDAPVVAVPPVKAAPAPVASAGGISAILATVTGWISDHPYFAALGGAVAVYLIFLRGSSRGRIF